MLPIKSPKYYEYQINDKVIEFRAWKTIDEKEFLILKENKENITERDIYEYLIKPCLKDPSIPLTFGERQMLIIEIRKKSYGDNVDIRYVCSECGKYNESQLSLSSMITYHPYNFSPVTVNGITVTFKPFTEEIEEKDLVELNFKKFVRHVDTIAYDNKVYNDFTFDEACNFFNNLDASIFDKMFEALSKQIENITYDATATCFSCKHVQQIDLGDIPNLFPW